MKKHWKYLKYIIRHKWFVMKVCFSYKLYVSGIFHDLSKFCSSEWGPYAEFFYGKNRPVQKGNSITKDDSEAQRAFDRAWLTHQHRNPHHWQYWILRQDDGQTKVLRMPAAYVIEMVCDWVGAGRAIQGKKSNARKWYSLQKDKIRLHPDTKIDVENLMMTLPL